MTTKKGTTKAIFTVNDKKILFNIKKNEKMDRIYGKLYAYALYKSRYPGVMVDKPLNSVYKPDVLAMNEKGEPVFWAESGKVNTTKMANLLKNYLNVHFVFIKIRCRIGETVRVIQEITKDLKRTAPVELVLVPGEHTKYISPDGKVNIRQEDCKITSFVY